VIREGWIPARVRARYNATDSIAVFDLEPISEGPVADSPAGSHIDVRVGPEGIVRQYSLCARDSLPGTHRIAVLRVDPSRGGSSAMHDLRVGDTVEVSKPRQNFGLAEVSRHILLAGGIGITPLIAMAWSLDRSGGDYHLHYVARSRETAVFVPDLHDNPRATLHFTGGDRARRPDAVTLLGPPDPKAAVYVCGPESFTSQMLAGAADLGWAPSALHTERFGAAETKDPAQLSFAVRLASTGAQYEVPPDRSILQVLRANRVRVDFSCEQGICGECVVTALAGTPDHRDDVLTDSEREGGAVAICVSRSQGPLLELEL